MKAHALLAVLALSATGSATAAAPGATGCLEAVVLGSGSPHFNRDRAGPSVLVRCGSTEIVVDTGNGTQAGLDAQGVAIRDLDGVLFTHHHLDHNEELVPILIKALVGGGRLVLAGPAPTAAHYRSALENYREDIAYRLGRVGRSADQAGQAITVSELAGGERLTIGSISARSASVNHTIAALSWRFEAEGRAIVVTGDLTYSPNLAELARDADVLIIDGGGTIMQGRVQRGGGGTRSGGQRGGGSERAHVTLEDTARMAREAGVKSLVLIHFTPGTIDEAATRAELQRLGYSGPVVFAKDGLKL